jgi:hypothetical protein
LSQADSVLGLKLYALKIPSLRHLNGT